ncbi:MAG: hypothetical protein AAF725_19185 [Acidobacteriota bacterium]
MLEFRLEDGTSLGEAGFDLGILQASAASEPLRLDIAYRWGEPAGEILEDLIFRLATEDPERSGVGLMKGVPPQDELWARARFVGQNNAADPQQADFRTDWLPLGAYLAIPFPTLHAGCSRRVELVWQLPYSAQGSWVFLPTVDFSEHSRALASPHPLPGIVTGAGDRARSGLIRGGQLSVSDPPDDQIHIAPCQLLASGEILGRAAVSLALDRVDGAGNALEDGAIYRARLALTADAAVEARRGEAGLEPAAPPLEPQDVASLGLIRVEAPDGGGLPVIEAEDLEEGAIFDRFRIEAIPDRLEVRVHAGDAVGGGTWRFWRLPSPAIALPASSMSYLWQLADGRYDVTPDPKPPAPTALGPWAKIETDETGVLRLEDRRSLSGQSVVLTLEGEVLAPGPVGRLLVPVNLQVDRVLVTLDAEPTGPVSFDLLADGESRLVPETLPSFDLGGPVLHSEALLETARCFAGTVLELHAVAVAAPVTVSVALVGLVG